MTYVVNPELIQVLSEIRDELKEIRKELFSTNSQLSGIEHQIYNRY